MVLCLVGEGGSEDGGGRPITAPAHTPVKKGMLKDFCGSDHFLQPPVQNIFINSLVFISSKDARCSGLLELWQTPLG